MPYFVYILRSEYSGRYYCGSTGNLDARIRQHNDPDYTLTRTTKVFPGPWILVHKEEFENRSDAMRREKQIKKHGVNRTLLELNKP